MSASMTIDQSYQSIVENREDAVICVCPTLKTQNCVCPTLKNLLYQKNYLLAT